VSDEGIWPDRRSGLTTSPLKAGAVSFGGGLLSRSLRDHALIESEEHVHFLADEIAKVGAPFVFRLPLTKPTGPALRLIAGPVEGRVRILKSVRDRAFRC